MHAISRPMHTTTPWRPPYWPFHITERYGTLLRWIARAWLTIAVIIFAVQALRGQIPRGLDRESWEVTAQLAALGIVTLGGVIALRWQSIGASIITIAAVVIGVLASIRFPMAEAFVITMVFFLPAFLFWLDWQRTRSVTVIVALALAIATILGSAGYASIQVYAAYRGPTHPASALTAEPVTLVEWIWSGAPTETSITVNAKLTRDSDDVYLLVSESADMRTPIIAGPWFTNQALHRTVSITVDGLKPGTAYHYAIAADGATDLSRQGQFQTLAQGPFAFTFAVGGCARTGSNGQVYDAIREQNPLFFLSTGDLYYENITENNPDAYSAAFAEVLTAPAQAALYRSTPIVYVWDDHDFGPNNADMTAPGAAAAMRTYREVVPHYPLATGEQGGPIYQAFTVGRVRFIVTDSRSAKTPASEPDGPAKSVLGAEQKAWFKQELLAANGTYPLIVWVTTVPWIGDASEGADNWAGYATERAELANFIADNHIEGLLMLSGDAHMVAIDDGTNSDYSTSGGAGFPVFHAAALDRRGSVKGGPYSEGTYPDGGQFGLVTVNDDGGSTITVTLSGRNYQDEELVSYTFSVDAVGTR